MNEDFLIENHPWNKLKERMSNTFPSNEEINVMKGVLDGRSLREISNRANTTVSKTKENFVKGMKKAQLKTIYDLVLWGLRTGIIRDEPKPEITKLLQSNHNYDDLRFYLNRLVTGDVDMPKSSQESFKKAISHKFNIGSSDASIIRFAFQVMNPITPPNSIRGFKPHIPHYVKTGVSPKLAIIPSKFKAADIDPNLHPNYQPIQLRKVKRSKTDTIGRVEKMLNISNDKPKSASIVPTQKGSIQMALKILGIHPSVIKNIDKSNSFWDNKPSYLWNILELAKLRFDKEIAHAHPDKGGDVNRARQVNVAWKFVRDMFKRRGYELHK